MTAEQEKPKKAIGRPVGSKGIKKSKLRKTEAKLLALQDKALENIAKSVNGQNVDKEILTSSKWTINTLVTVSRSAIAEEKDFVDLKADLNDGVEQEQEEEEIKPRFSLTVLPTKKDLE